MHRITLALLITLCLLLTSAARAASPASGGGGGGGGAHGGEAKLSPIPTVPQAIAPAVTTLVVFALLLAVLGKFAWGPIASGLKAREEKIRRDIADAEAARVRSEATLRQYNEQLAAAEGRIREMMTKATADAERIATNLRMQAQQESEEIKERASRDIEAARRAALADIYAQAAELSTSVAERILRRNLNADDQRDLVDRSLEQFQTAGAKA
ncbi:MAG TPA: F0F1 ATP synthase subunit B [Tepidisphaeraceae bacterium]|nr:F0F1 ATP synthase subunit B [Tepidisphaeraceae bacterium]